MGVKSALLKGLKDAATEKKVAIQTEFEKAHAIAQKNAALPIEQGGLGLPADNTAMDRAIAMGFDKDVYHGSYSDITNIDPEKFSNRVDYMKGFFTADNPEIAGNYGDVVYPLKQSRGVQVSDRRTARREGREVPDLDTVFDTGRGVNVTNNPSNIRSPNAAFDPLKRNSPNLLASAGAGAAVAGGALYTPEENQAQAGVATKSVSELAERLKGMEGVKTLNLYETNNGDLKLDTLIIDKDKRNKGIGSNVMNEINSFADDSGKRVVLTPAVKDDFQGTTSRSRLVKYYKGHGFQENKGRKKDYSISEGMIREPQKGAATPQSIGTLAALSGGANAIYNAAKNNTLGEAVNYAQDAANMVGYIPTAGMLTTSDIIGGIGKAGAAVTGNLDAYNANVSPYIERAGETQSQLGKQVEQAIGYGVQQAAPYVMPYVTPVYNNVMKKWEQIEATPSDANLFGFIDELNRKSNAKLFR